MKKLIKLFQSREVKVRKIPKMELIQMRSLKAKGCHKTSKGWDKAIANMGIRAKNTMDQDTMVRDNKHKSKVKVKVRDRGRIQIASPQIKIKIKKWKYLLVPLW